MSKLNVDQKSVLELLSAKKSKFLIPDYQRPYAWTEDQCQTLWDDLFSFAIPDDNAQAFDDDEEYFLGSVVTFKNEHGQLEVIDGQQRLTTLLLILRAFYDKFANMKDPESERTRDMIEKCIWATNTFGIADKDVLKINSEVATDNDKEQFLKLLKTGLVPEGTSSQYVVNYRFFQQKIAEFLDEFPSYFAYLPARILGNCILLPIEAESQDTALRIFSTLNDRGLPLSDADIFKAQFYKYYGDRGEKDTFIEDWKNLEEVSGQVFKPSKGTPMDELFTRYMYYLRAKARNKNTTVEAVRKFFERDKYAHLKNDEAMRDLKYLVDFWQSVAAQDAEVFSASTLRKLYALNYAHNSMWEYMTSVYFLQNRDEDGALEESDFNDFLDKITAFIFAYGITNPGVNALRTPAFEEMINIIDDKPVLFSRFKFDEQGTRSMFENYVFKNQRPITRSFITWYALTFDEQGPLSLGDNFQIEHIFPKKRQEMESSLKQESNLDSLGNKVLLEASINSRASDYRFEDKKKIYSGEMRRGRNRQPSKIAEIQELIERDRFEESDIMDREKLMFDSFFGFLREQELLK